jgi:hypothetical protein
MIEYIVAGREGDNIRDTIAIVAYVVTGLHERDKVPQCAPDSNHEEDYRDPK